MPYLGEEAPQYAYVDPALVNISYGAKQEAAAEAGTAPIIPGAPTWLTSKNLLIGGGVTFATILAYLLLVPPKKKSAPVSGLGWLFKRHRRRKR